MRYDITLSLGDYITYISRFIRRNMWKMIKRKSIFKNSIIPSTIGTKAFRESDLNSEENHATFSCLKISQIMWLRNEGIYCQTKVNLINIWSVLNWKCIVAINIDNFHLNLIVYWLPTNKKISKKLIFSLWFVIT